MRAEVECGGGAEEDRTPDLRIANATLSQLSYGPNFFQYNAIPESLESEFRARIGRGLKIGARARRFIVRDVSYRLSPSDSACVRGRM